MLSAEHWDWVQRALPIACVDLIPVQYNSSSEIARVGLIRRLAPVEPAWCLIGGRILYGEQIEQAGQRILLEAGGPTIRLETADWTHPDYLAEYLPGNVAGLSDPRKHAIGLTFIVTITGAFEPEGEALNFDWFDLTNLPVQLGFGQRTILDEVFGQRAQPR